MYESNDGGASPPIVKEIHIDAPPEIVYEYLTLPDKIAQWMGLEIDVDPRPGGIFRISPNGVDVILGAYVETTPYSKVSFTWGFDGEGHGVPAGSSIVEITLEPTESGTFLRLVHRNLLDEEWRARHDSGWDHYLLRIAAAAEGHPVGPDPWAAQTHRHG